MEFRIADTFTTSLAKLTGDEQKAVKTTAFDLQMNVASPGLRFHKLDRAKDPNFWSVSVNMDIRLIVHRTSSSMLLCYVDHHDQAYRWAERRKLETHPKTGAAQIVEIRETVKEIVVPRYDYAKPKAVPRPRFFEGVSEETLLSHGVPEEWVSDVLAADEDSLLALADHLPAEAAEAVLELAVGGQPALPVEPAAGMDPFAHPDAQRRFRLVTEVEELAQALDYPWERWMVFLHPAQQQLVEKDFAGPARVAGSAGTGKTVVALHRAVHLARSNPDARVLLATFSDSLARTLHQKLAHLIASSPRLGERIEVDALDAVALRLHKARGGADSLLSRLELGDLLEQAAEAAGEQGFSRRFLLGEWEDVVDAWDLRSWDAYRDVKRLGRKTRLPEAARQRLWSVFERLRALLDERGATTRSQVYHRLAAIYEAGARAPYDFAVVDEAQDISAPQLRFLAAIAGERANGLFFAGDLGQRIFQAPFSWKSLGVDVRGRSRTLRVNYRTSHQIRTQADRLLGPEVSDVDGNVEARRGTVSVFNGPPPDVRVLDEIGDEARVVGEWLAAAIEEGIAPHEIGAFVRSESELERALAAGEAANVGTQVLDQRVSIATGKICISTMHLAKGLEFRAVVVMACDDEVLPLQSRIEAVADDVDLQEVYDTERHLLYVACTRARDHLLVTGVDPASEFLDDLVGQ